MIARVSAPSYARALVARSFCDLTLADLEALGPPGSATHLFGQLHRPKRWHRVVDDGVPAIGAPVLGQRLRAFVDDQLDLALPTVAARRESRDGSTKLLLRLADGQTIETVHMPRDVKNPRVTLCLSSQVGCAMGCTFCHTAQMGLARNLTAGEIVGQVLTTLRALGPDDPGRVTLVFMGMGEPLHNLTAVRRAIEVLTQPAGLGLAPMRITVSTAGLADGIRAIAAWPSTIRPCLALSVNATTDSQRSLTMPVTKRHGLAELRAALQGFPLRTHEKITLEYVLLAGRNDAEGDIERLASFARGLRCVINVIPWNRFGQTDFDAPDEGTIERFSRGLLARGAFVTVRRSRGEDVGAACGQLAVPRLALSR